jgi:hypothetical protein
MVLPTTLAPTRWPTCVRALARLGFNAIDVPLVWRDHELAPGRFDFASHDRNIGAFLSVVADEGLHAIVRLGPWPIVAVRALGLPDRVLHDRACQARTRKQHPVYVLDLPGLAALPSLASERYRDEAATWIRAAVEAIADAVHAGTVTRVVVGHGATASLRDDFFEFDHHPDARGNEAPVAPPHAGDPTEALREVRRQTSHALQFLDHLARTAVVAGVPEAAITFATQGAQLVSPLALAIERPIVSPAPPPRAGVTGIWREVRFTSQRAGAHLDLRAGNGPFEPPTRATHTLQAARIAIAAGARSFTVQMGAAGHGWIGALLDEQGTARTHAARWADTLAWSATLPDGDDEGVSIDCTRNDVDLLRASSGVHPLPAGLLAWAGLRPSELVARGAASPGSLDALEDALIARSVPYRRRLGTAHDAHGDTTQRVADAREALAPWLPRVSPEGAALVRVIRGDTGRTVVLASRVEGPLRYAPPPHGRWRDAAGWIDGDRALAGGDVAVLREVSP